MISRNIVYVISTLLICSVRTEVEYNPSSSLNVFALKLLAQTSSSALNDSNVVLSPYSIWTAMSIVNEGAAGNTTIELSKTLGIPLASAERQEFRKVQHSLVKHIVQQRAGVVLHVANSIFTKSEAKLNPNFLDIVGKVYDADVEPLDFKNTSFAAQYINKKIFDATKGRIPEIVNAGDIRNTQMFITSALFFKGVWQEKFNKLSTRILPFYNEQEELVANVSMMENAGSFVCGSILNGKAEAIELPYLGNISMLVILPNENISLSTVVSSLAETPFIQIIKDLTLPKLQSTIIDVRIQLPKMNITSDFKLNHDLYGMGIRDAFSEESADLTGISDSSLYVSQVTHKADIEVDEYGTEGSATTTVDIVDKDGSIPIAPPIPFIVNRPFAFIIFDKGTSSILLAGTIRKPNKS